ncbi:MAG: hypothetical protein WC561_03810 [Candidatus Omnitrophota bacterium]|jgi:uncharacterized cysteine cluster protein YcgN (CxxCxxCC family)
MDDIAYSQKQKEEQEQYESLCRRCGACCGAYSGDPCLNLEKEPSGKYRCKVYENRIGMQKTVSGKNFACVPIRDLRPNLPFKGCAYY